MYRGKVRCWARATASRLHWYGILSSAGRRIRIWLGQAFNRFLTRYTSAIRANRTKARLNAGAGGLRASAYMRCCNGASVTLARRRRG